MWCYESDGPSSPALDMHYLNRGQRVPDCYKEHYLINSETGERIDCTSRRDAIKKKNILNEEAKADVVQ